MTMTILYASRDARDAAFRSPMEQGASQSYDWLATLLDAPR